MKAAPQCPRCLTPTEVAEVTPCAICGGWPAAVAGLDPSAEFTEYRLPNGATLVLCRGCVLDEFMVPGGWGYDLVHGEPLPVNGLQPVRTVAARLGRDRVCPDCHLRLPFARRVAALDPPNTW